MNKTFPPSSCFLGISSPATAFRTRVPRASTLGAIASFCFLAFGTGLHAGQIYRVNIGGGDTTGDGSTTKPWATLKHACQQVPPDQDNSIQLGPGVFVDSTRITSPATLPRNVSLVGSGKTSTTYTGEILIPDASNILIADFSLDGRENTTAQTQLFRGLRIHTNTVQAGTGVEVRNLRIEGFWGDGLRLCWNAVASRLLEVQVPFRSPSKS